MPNSHEPVPKWFPGLALAVLTTGVIAVGGFMLWTGIKIVNALFP